MKNRRKITLILPLTLGAVITGAAQQPPQVHERTVIVQECTTESGDNQYEPTSEHTLILREITVQKDECNPTQHCTQEQTFIILDNATAALEQSQQPAGCPQDSLTVVDTEGNNLITITSHPNRKDTFSVMISGFRVDIRDMSSPTMTRNKPHGYLSMINHIEFGFNGLTDPGYGLYERGDRGFLELNMGKSFSFQMDIVSLNLYIDRRSRLKFSSAIAFKSTNYVFERNLTVTNADGLLTPVYLRDNKKKSKLTTFSIRLPVLLEYEFPNKLWIGAGVYGEMVTGQHTKYKKPVVVERKTYNMNFLNAGATLKAGFKGIYVFGNVGFTPMFKSGQGPTTQPFTIGFGIR